MDRLFSTDMNSRPIQRLLCTRFVHFFATRLCWGRLRSLSFDEKYRSGQWNFVEDPHSELVTLIEERAANGHILILGCGMASITTSLNPARYKSIVGIDLSPVAIGKARQYANEKIRFEVGNMLTYTPDKKFGIMLFSESLYYVAGRKRVPLLKRLRDYLAPGGYIIVTIAQPERFAGLLNEMRSDFDVIEDRYFTDSRRFLIVFR
jgi:trans-aconitate methyltransferase